MVSYTPLRCTECQNNIATRLADLDLTAGRRYAIIPNNAGTLRIRAGQGDFLPAEGVAEDVAQIIPDLVGVFVERVREDGLRRASIQAIGGEGDFDCFTASRGIVCEGLAV